jgi:hypothetical protein
MYARIENNIAVEYPLYEGDLERRFPDLLFPMDRHGTAIPEGYVRVTSGQIENYDFKFKYNEVAPILVDGKYVQHWEAIELTNEEKQLRYAGIASQVRNQRNELLQKSDILVLSDVWETYSSDKKASLTAYRTALRNVPTQADFPYSVTWPTI